MAVKDWFRLSNKMADDSAEWIETKGGDTVIGLNDELSAYITAGRHSANTPAAALRLYEKSSVVTVPVNWIAELFSELDPVLVTDGTIETAHPFLDDLRNPSPYYSRKEFFEKIAKDFLITGECAMLPIGGAGRPPIEVQPLSPSELSINNESGRVGSFQVTGETFPGLYPAQRTGPREVQYWRDPLTQVSQLRGYSTRNDGLLRGQSPLLATAMEVTEHILGNEHNVSVLEKGGRVSLVFHFKRRMRKEEHEEMKQRIRLAYGGASKGGEIAVVNGEDLDIKEVGIRPKDMDFKSLQEMARASLLLQYRLPLALAFIDASTLDNYTQGKLSLYDDAVLPLASRLFPWLMRVWGVRHGLDPQRTELRANEEAIPALRERKLKEMESRRKINAETDDEIRAQMGYGPYTGAVPNAAGSAIRDTAARAPIEELIDAEEDPELMSETVFTSRRNGHRHSVSPDATRTSTDDDHFHGVKPGATETDEADDHTHRIPQQEPTEE